VAARDQEAGSVIAVTGKRPRGAKPCNIVSVGKRRDGGTRYWCLEHRADATAKYGRRSRECRYAHIPRISASETVTIDVDKYSGGVGIWGAVPPVFDTTTLGIDRGIHVHARRDPRGDKEIDQTYRRVRIKSGDISVDIDELDAIYFMVSMIFGKEPKEVICTYCTASHLDKDWFSVHPHRRHLCAACGKHFRDDKVAIGNPAATIASALGGRPDSKHASKTLMLRQKDYPGGIRLWGSNNAIVWTAKKAELTGIHVHAYKVAETSPDPGDIDETFGAVTIDDVALDPEAVRIYMAQMALPHLAARVVAGMCEDCGTLAFDRGDAALVPSSGRTCNRCQGHLQTQSRFRKVVANPLIGVFRTMAEDAVRPPQKHDLGLLPETI
jgi:hypothetical protein